jgi:hypothetical protein
MTLAFVVSGDPYLYELVNTDAGWCSQAVVYTCGIKVDMDRARVLSKYLELNGGFYQRAWHGRVVMRIGVYLGTVALERPRLQPTIRPGAVT